jgi:DNA primase
MILVEGNIDVITLHQYGFDCAVASLGTSLTEEHAALLSRYTEQVVLTYDGDEAGQRAAKRAIPMLEKAGIRVKVLKMRDAKDPDEFLHKFGPDAFRLLLEESSNRVDYQLGAIAAKYDLKDDDQKIRYVQEAAELICTLDSSVKREVYGTRVAEKAGITPEAMKLEVNKAFKRRLAREKKQQEKIDLAPAQALQPKIRSVRYQNMKSAMAEEAIIGKALRQPSLLSVAPQLSGQDFSVALLGNVYDQLRARYDRGLEVSLGVIGDLTAEEMSHIAGIMQRHAEPGSEDAFRDCVQIILHEKQAAAVSSDEDLLALRNKMKESKGRLG